MNIGFTLHWPTPGTPHIEFLRPNPPHPQRPDLATHTVDPHTGSAAVLLGRLFYRSDLLARLPGVDPTVADVDLVLAVYRRGGAAALEWLEGEFALLVWDARQRRLLACRDPFGAWPLYWFRQGTALIVSTSLERLACISGGLPVDPDYLAAYLMQPHSHAELPLEQTALTGARRVLPGSIVEFREGRPPIARRYWDWDERIVPLPGIALNEAGERFCELLRSAVRERLCDGPVAAHLSGGMDSSAVVCLAVAELGRQGAGPLHTLSLVYRGLGLAGERRYIDDVIRQTGALTPHLAEADDLVDYDWFDQDLPRHDEPFDGLSTLAAERRMMLEADRIGARVTLSGLGSDEIVDCQPYFLADLLRSGRWLRCWRAARACATAWNLGVWSVLSPFALQPVLAAWSRTAPLSWLRRRARWPHVGWFDVPPWVRPDFARRHRLRQLGHEHARSMYRSPVTRSQERLLLTANAGDWYRWFLAAPRGLHQSHPFMDPRLACFGLGIPEEVRGGGGGEVKPVLQQATRGILPESIRTRRGKCGFDESTGRGLARSLPRLEEMVGEAQAPELECLDRGELIAVMRQTAAGLGDVVARLRMGRTLALVVWLEQQRRWSAQWQFARDEKPLTLRHLEDQAMPIGSAGVG
jgi:asparagine synthase (glutamine-hydrolysing)